MVEWADTQIHILIDEHRNRNEEYHNFGRDRIRFWDSIATRINQEHNTSFNGHQCKEKFSNIVRDYNLMCDYMAGNRRARRSRTGAQYFDKFRTHFWERPEDEFDRIHTLNTSNRRQNRDVGNITPTPSIEEVEHRTSVEVEEVEEVEDGQHPRDDTNINTNNPDGVNPEISTLQPPPYEATDETQNISQRLAHTNSSKMNQSHVVSSHEVANSGNNLTPNLLNMPSSQNESDVSMHDVDPSGHCSQ
ncbi:12496_t:CDS:2 [Acaulospora morrowiae]|uniref:12496_t:CDS:1 n=1 Tax=Acaulospora morrowiae TaxID=94023 RepID=A0A9N9EG49_9GLOM|nr:12496_t:CDS:2 [Acaulospora morrowiae]